MTQPNIIIFNPDSYRGDVQGHLGNPGAYTPNLDAIVEADAVSYRHAFAQNPVCTPSRCSFMTGLYPHVHGHRSMRNLLKAHERHLFNVLRDSGYVTWWGGKNDLLAVDEGLDYDDHCDIKYEATPSTDGAVYPSETEEWMYGAFYKGVVDTSNCRTFPADKDTAIVNGAVDFIQDAPADKPFFMFLALGNPHPAYVVEDAYLEHIDADALPYRIPPPDDLSQLPPIVEALHESLPSNNVTDEQWREVKRIYYGMCTKIDALFGKVVEALKSSGLYNSTLLIFMSDHGDFAGDYSLPEKTHSSLQDALINVPFVIKPPEGITTSPGIRDQLIELVDMPATIYDYAGITPDYDVQGKSLRQSIEGDDDAMRDYVFAEVGSRKDETQFINSDVDKMPKDGFYPRQAKGSIPVHQAGSYAVSCRSLTHKYVRRGYGKHELYDLKNDPGETRNIYDPQHTGSAQSELETALLDYFMTTGDVLPHKQDKRW